MWCKNKPALFPVPGCSLPSIASTHARHDVNRLFGPSLRLMPALNTAAIGVASTPSSFCLSIDLSFCSYTTCQDGLHPAQSTYRPCLLRMNRVCLKSLSRCTRTAVARARTFSRVTRKATLYLGSLPAFQLGSLVLCKYCLSVQSTGARTGQSASRRRITASC